VSFPPSKFSSSFLGNCLLGESELRVDTAVAIALTHSSFLFVLRHSCAFQILFRNIRRQSCFRKHGAVCNYLLKILRPNKDLYQCFRQPSFCFHDSPSVILHCQRLCEGLPLFAPCVVLGRTYTRRNLRTEGTGWILKIRSYRTWSKRQERAFSSSETPKKLKSQDICEKLANSYPRLISEH